MPADLTKPFDNSCCDGGECSINKESAQPCGCDPGAGWVCAIHEQEWEAFMAGFTAALASPTYAEAAYKAWKESR